MDVLWDEFSIGGLLHLERCQLLLLYPLMPLWIPSAGVTKYGPPLSGGSLGLLGFLTEDSITPPLYLLFLIYFMVLF
jgi:hypothetical protein